MIQILMKKIQIQKCLKDVCSFNVYDYTYVKDFIYELSWEGSVY